MIYDWLEMCLTFKLLGQVFKLVWKWGGFVIVMALWLVFAPAMAFLSIVVQNKTEGVVWHDVKTFFVQHRVVAVLYAAMQICWGIFWYLYITNALTDMSPLCFIAPAAVSSFLTVRAFKKLFAK